jgi:hypothetical protein
LELPNPNTRTCPIFRTRAEQRISFPLRGKDGLAL